MPKASLIKYSHGESYQQRQLGLFSEEKKIDISILEYKLEYNSSFLSEVEEKMKLQFSATILWIYS